MTVEPVVLIAETDSKKACAKVRFSERNGADDAAGQPEHVDDEKAHALVEGRRAGPGGRGRCQRQAAGHEGGEEEHLRIGMAVIDVDEGRDQHRDGKIDPADCCDIDG